MNYKIICDFCETENYFSNRFEAPSECSNKACQHSLAHLEIIKTEDKHQKKENVIKESPITGKNKKDIQGEAVGLELIYQKNSKKIVIKNNNIVILGRNKYGKEILNNISQISRSHCSIEHYRGEFIVKDLGSTNGTFIGLGADKINCKNPQKIKENDFLVLGQEVFLIKYIREEKKDVIEAEKKEDEEILCSDCSCVLHELPCTCPDCGTWNG